MPFLPARSRVLRVTLSLALAGPATAADEIREETVRFEKGASSTTIRGTLKGEAGVDYLVRAAAGQTLAVELKGTNQQNYFNVLPPGSANVAMHVAQDGKGWSGLLPSDGDYKIRVYLMRAAARRKESSSYTLTVGVTGRPLPPLPASKDAKVGKTPYHATARVNCALPYKPDVKSCDAGVVRRGHDGTATFEAMDQTGVQRRILFVAGKPVAADAMDPLTATRHGDLTVVRVGDAERYEIPDTFLNGG